MHPVRIGCSGWNYASWRGVLYEPGLPAGRWLERYAQHFDTVEVNATFYRLVRPASAQRWLEQVPEDFTFAVKASRYLTHVRRLRDLEQGPARLFESIAPLRRADRVGAVLWQLPETFHRDDDRLANALVSLPPGRHAVEFRHPSWFHEAVYALLRAHDAALVIGDHPTRPFQTIEATASWRYVRLHHGRRGRRGNYSERELDEWARRIDRWRREGEVLVYCNNDWEGFAPRNASRLRALVARYRSPPASGATS